MIPKILICRDSENVKKKVDQSMFIRIELYDWLTYTYTGRYQGY